MAASAYTVFNLSPVQKTNIVANHNFVRLNWKVPALKNSNTINGWSDFLASKAALVAANCTFEHSSQNFRKTGQQDEFGSDMYYGENLALASTSDLTKTTPIVPISSHTNNWKGEEADWDCTKKMYYNFTNGLSENGCKRGFKTPGHPYMCGHFTQVVWYKTFEIGCALINCPSGSPINPGTGSTLDFFVCWYNLGGNLLGDHPLDPAGGHYVFNAAGEDIVSYEDKFTPCPNGNVPYATTAPVPVNLMAGQSLSAEANQDNALSTTTGFFAVFVSATVICGLIVVVSLLVGVIAFVVFLKKKKVNEIQIDTKDVSLENDSKGVSLETQE